MARAYPWMVRRVYDTVANHTQKHPIHKISVTQAAREHQMIANADVGGAELRLANGVALTYAGTGTLRYRR